jgi:ferredoxin-like protein FixX
MADNNFNVEEFMKLNLNKLTFRDKGVETGNFISYDPDKCDGCGECALVCSVNIWAVKENKAKLSPKYKELCLECAACYATCETDAISFQYPAGGSGIVIKHG